ncbi:MAG: hypothetical protein E7190_11825 [Erysipelotrichaceae bacterium]|nr:hypothetical protein [Erysipelotrichaceae bacterium]
MKTVIVFKLCKDPRDANIGPDGTVDFGMASLKASDDDFRSTEIAKLLSTETAGLTIGSGDTAWAAARGASETTVITDADESEDKTGTARLLASAVRDMDADLVLIGDSTWEPSVPVLLGAELGWTSLAGIVDVKQNENGYTAVRRTSSGEKEIRFAAPAVLGIVAKSGEETPPGLKQVLMARKKPVRKVLKADLCKEISEHADHIGYELPETTDAVMISAQTPEETVKKLFAVLKEDGVLQ